MGDGLHQKRNEAQPARHRIEPAVDPDRAAPRATAILGLQRAAGNRAVAQLLAQVAKPPRGTIQRLRTADQWVTDTTTFSGIRKKKEKRSEGLKAIDARLLEYEAAYGRGDLDAAMAALNEVADLLGKWRIAAEPKIRGTFSKEERAAAEAHGAKKVKNWQQVADMQKEVEAEIKLLQHAAERSGDGARGGESRDASAGADRSSDPEGVEGEYGHQREGARAVPDFHGGVPRQRRLHDVVGEGTSRSGTRAAPPLAPRTAMASRHS